MRASFLGHLIELCARPSPPGEERSVAEYIVGVLGPTTRTDRVGNLMWSRGAPPYVLLCAHMDTVQTETDKSIIEDGAPFAYNGLSLEADPEVQLGFDDDIPDMRWR